MANDDRLLVLLEARTADFEKRMARAERAGSKSFQKIEQDAANMRGKVQQAMTGAGQAALGLAKGFAAPLLALGAAGIVQQVGQIANSIATIGDEAARAGLAVDVFQELAAVARTSRVPVDALVDGIKELNLRGDEFAVTGAGSAAEAFTRLGYTADELREKLKDPSALFTEIIGKLGELDRAAQIRVADEIFGGTGGEKFVQLIAQGEAGIRSTIQTARDLGQVMDSDVIAKADDLDRAFADVANTVSTSLQQSIINASYALFDFLQQFKAVEDRTTTSLDQRLGDLGRKIVDLDREAMQADSDSRSDPMKQSLYQGFAVQAREEIALLREEEKLLLSILEKRREEVNPPGSTVPPTVITTPTTPGGGRAPGVAAAMAEANAVMSLIEALEYEQTTIGMTARELAVANALRDAGSAATANQKARIEELVMANFDATASQDAMAQSMQQLDSIAQSVGQSLVDAFSDGKLEATELLNIVMDVIGQLIRMPSLGGGGLGAMHGGALTFGRKETTTNEQLSQHNLRGSGRVDGGRCHMPAERDLSGTNGQGNSLPVCADDDRGQGGAQRLAAA